MSTKTKYKGFTIIEVVLVLAIAALIFMMVFIALPALQRNQRDTQRKNDLSRVVTAINSYSSSNRGSLPTSASLTSTATTSFANTYLTTAGDSFIDPSGTAPSGQTGYSTYQFILRNTALSAPNGDYSTVQNRIYFSPGYTCSDTGPNAVTAAGSRKIAFRIYLEGGGFHCVNN